MHVFQYDSLSAMLNDAQKAVGKTECRTHGSELKWAGGRLLRDAIAFVRKGATEDDMKLARELMQKIDASIHDRTRNEWVPSVHGAYACVPDFLIGLPDNMRTQQQMDSDVAPIRMFIEPTVSAGIEHRTLVKRGAAIAALIARMSEERPTELYVCSGMKACNALPVLFAAKLDVAPINLSQCIATISDASFLRQVVFSHAAIMGGAQQYRVGTNWIGGTPGSNSHIAAMRKELGITEPDIFIEGGYLPDESLMDRDPVAWVHKQLERQRLVID